MAVSSLISRVYDLNKPLVKETLDRVLAMGDDQGDQFNIAVTNGSEPKDLLGGSVLGYFIKIESGKKIEDCETITIFGSTSKNIATIILPKSCYIKPCRFVLTIKVSIENTRHAVYIAEGSVIQTSTDHLIDPGHNIPDVEELLALIDQFENAGKAATEATQRANDAAKNANQASSHAEEVATKVSAWNNVTASVTMLSEDSSPIVDVTDISNGKKMSFKLPRGLTGLTPNLKIGTVKTGLPGTQAFATIGGTRENPILDLILPQGATGAIENLSIRLQGDVTGYATGEKSGDIVIEVKASSELEEKFVTRIEAPYIYELSSATLIGASGIVSNSLKTMYIWINMGRPISESVNRIVIMNMSGSIRGISGYLNSTSGYVTIVGPGANFSANVHSFDRETGSICIMITSPEQITNSLNNTPIHIMISSLKLAFVS